MADESFEKKEKRIFKPKNLISKNRRLSKTNTSIDEQDRSNSFDGNNSQLKNEAKNKMSKSNRASKSYDKSYRDYVDSRDQNFDSDFTKSGTGRGDGPHYSYNVNQSEYSSKQQNLSDINSRKASSQERVSPTGSSKFSSNDQRKYTLDHNSSKNRSRPETKPGSSTNLNIGNDHDNGENYSRKKNNLDNLNVLSDTRLAISPAAVNANNKHIEKDGDVDNNEPQRISPNNVEASNQPSRLINVKRVDAMNSNENTEQARLLGVRRLDTPEPRRKHELSEDSEGSSNISDSVPPDVFLPKRYILAIMMFMGFINMYAIRVNLNVAIGAMVNNHTVIKNGIAVTMEPEFDWSSRLQGVVLGSFYYGYMVLQIPGGYFAMRYGGTKIFGGAIFAASLFSLLTPVATRSSVWALVILRVLEGLALGVMLPCNHQIWSVWAPLQERTTLVTIALAGMNVGTVITMPLTGLLTKYGFDGGWASVFYCFGILGIVWYILWVFVVHNTPNSHPTISKQERNYINRSTIVRKGISVPWKAILTSKPVYAVIIGNIANDWGLYTILICLPLFLMDIMRFNVQTMGFIASLPFLLKAIVGPVGGVISDILRYKYMSTKNARRLFYIIGAMGAAILIVIAGYSTTPTVAVLSMCIGVALSGLLHSGYEVNILDIAPSLSGIVMGISNTLGTTTGFLSPLLVGYMTENKLRSEWITVFWITFCIYLIGTALFCLMLSGDAQHWAVDVDENEDKEYSRDRPKK